MSPQRKPGAGKTSESKPVLYLVSRARNIHLQRLRSTESHRRRVHRPPERHRRRGSEQETISRGGRFQRLVDGVGIGQDNSPGHGAPGRARPPRRRPPQHRRHADFHRIDDARSISRAATRVDRVLARGEEPSPPSSTPHGAVPQSLSLSSTPECIRCSREAACDYKRRVLRPLGLVIYSFVQAHQ
ncbi:unnamed protein product [Trichogramma brassicae]|uniref:Uncharacterized protein n=1 Tax=Trichogramma brassicae TaxID=86971 RepID=A0A6H5IAZ7_9HYME|nr:unnamed protein product [Trichogramma brassicae]